MWQGNWYQTFKWTDRSMVEEIEDLKEKFDNIKGALVTLQRASTFVNMRLTLLQWRRMCVRIWLRRRSKSVRCNFIA